ncbi:phosphatidylglycerol lysyltransferase domain-containing protein, partial [Actinomadura rubrobrunea]
MVDGSAEVSIVQRTRPEGALRALAAITAGVAALLAVPALGDPPPVAAAASVLVTGGPLSPPHALVLASTVALLARGVLLGRRAAWYGLLVLVALGAVAVLAREDPPWRLPLLGAAAAALWRLRDGFPVRPHPDRVRAAVRTGAVLVIGSAAGAVLVGGVSVRSVGRDVAVGLGAMGSPLDGASWLPGALAVTGGAGLLLILLTLLAAAPAPPPGAEDERRRVARLVAHPGSDTLAPFALRRDKSYVFSPDGRAAIGYRVLFGVAVAGGDPVGDPASYEAAVARFLALCRRTGWRPAVLGAGADRL